MCAVGQSDMQKLFILNENLANFKRLPENQLRCTCSILFNFRFEEFAATAAVLTTEDIEC